MTIKFDKYQGTGNDFILIDGRNFDSEVLVPPVVERLCDRHFGIGADGLIMLRNAENADFEMVYFNSDGHPGTMCGNGGRCITAFAGRLGIINTSATFLAADGLHTGEILRNGDVKLSLNDVDKLERLKDGYFLDTGSPHYITIHPDVRSLDVYSEGRKLRHDPQFDAGTNVNFMELTGDGIIVRTYERGVEDETLSCGTGVTAAAIAAHHHDRTRTTPIRVQTNGGELFVDFKKEKKITGISLTGPASRVFAGEVEIPSS